MSDKKFTIILFILLGMCALLTIAHVIYAVYAYGHCSIIRFIGGELW